MSAVNDLGSVLEMLTIMVSFSWPIAGERFLDAKVLHAAGSDGTMRLKSLYHRITSIIMVVTRSQQAECLSYKK
jgi:hypothetical protein